MNYFKDFFGTRTVNGIEIIDLTKSIQFENLEDKLLVDYTIKDGETPETLSYNLYGTTDYWWINMVLNNIIDRFYEWPMDNNVLRDYYQFLVDNSFLADSEANFNNLVTENNAKRSIQVLDPKYIQEFLFQVESELG